MGLLFIISGIGIAIGVWLWWRCSGLGWWDFVILKVARLYSQLWHRWTSNGPPPFPGTGPGMVIINHTCSADPTFLLAGSARPLSFLVADEHYRVHSLIHRLLDHLRCVPVKRTGQDAVALRRALRRLQEGRLLCIFPEGNLSGVAQGRMRRPKLGAAFLALHSRLPVYPVFISGGPHTDELLPSWLWPSRQAVHIRFGPKIDLSAYHNQQPTRQLYEEVANLLMHRLTVLGTLPK